MKQHTMSNTNNSDNTGDELLNMPTQAELQHLQLQAMLRENSFPTNELMYLGERDGEHWYLVGGEHEVPVSSIVEVNPVD
tara:strand:- start:154 stop:393 length:240 start_codon:yes stop_codon:yes gene_type:complete